MFHFHPSRALPVILLCALLLPACLPSPGGASDLTPAALPSTPDISTPDTWNLTPETLLPTPAATETPIPTPIPGHTIEQLKAMTADEKLALAPEAPAGAVKSLYREAPGMVFYQDPETLSITSAYDLTTATAYAAPEQIPMPAIHITTDRDIFSLSNKYEKWKSDPNFDIQTAIDNFANIKDTALDGEEPFYRLRVLQAYRDGLIPNIPDSVPPPNLKIYDFNDIAYMRPFEINSQDLV